MNQNKRWPDMLDKPTLTDKGEEPKQAAETATVFGDYLRIMLLAFSFLTRLPLPVFEPQKGDFPRAALLFPLVGMMIGGAGALLYLGAVQVWPVQVAVVLGMLGVMWLTGVLHEDGLADCADGMWGGADKERRLEIMRDSRIGTYGAAALGSLMWMRWVLYLSLAAGGTLALSMICAHGLARTAACLLLARGPYVGGGKGSSFVEGLRPQALFITGLVPALFAVIFLGWSGLLGVALALLAALGCEQLFRRAIGGVNGDCLGAVACVTEVAFLLGSAARLN